MMNHLIMPGVVVVSLIMSSSAISADSLQVPAYHAGKDVTNRNFEGVNLELANFSGSNASGSSFVNASLDYANLSMANFHNTNLTNVSFKLALVEFTDFSGAEGLTADQLSEACLTRPEHEEKLGLADFDIAAYQLPEECKLWENIPRG